MKKSSLNFNKLRKLNVNGETYKNYSLKNLNGYRVGGNSKYFLKINTIEAFLKVMLYLNKENYPYFVLGNGSNTLISDYGYNGVIIKLSGDFARILVKDNEMEVGAGAMLGNVIAKASDLSLTGLECAIGIPASIGGAVCMNAQAYDFEMRNIILYVIAFVDNKITYFNKDDCKFSYRHSIFQENNAIILRVGIQLDYGDNKTIKDKLFEIASRRKNSQPLEYYSCGCVFKRIDGLNFRKMLDDDGFKGKKIGDAEVSEKHANFIINKGNATAKDIYNLIKTIKQEFYNLHQIELECEIKFLGRFE